MRTLVRQLNRFAAAFGFDPAKAGRALWAFPRFLRDLWKYRRLQTDSFPIRYSALYPCLADITAQAGSASGDYFHQDLWAARKIFQARPNHHIDVGSRIDGFIAHLLTFMPVTVIDIRPLTSRTEGLSFLQADATVLSVLSDGEAESISSLHAIEHFGLGRFGDPIDPDGCFKAMHSLARVLRRGGRLYFSVPIGRQRLEFNGQRVFSPMTVLQRLGPLRLLSFAAVDERGQYRAAAELQDFASARYACGLFEFTK